MDTITRIKQLAKEQKRSMAYLCEKMGVARVYFNDLEKSEREIPIDKLQIIAEALHTTVDYLLGMEQSIVIQNIIKLLEEQRKTQKNLTDYLGITQNAFTDWKSGRIKSYTKHLPKIAEYFGVTVDYLLGNEESRGHTEETNSPTAPKLSEGEEMWLELYHLLTDESKAILSSTLPTLQSLPKDKQAAATQSFLHLLSSLQ